MEKYAGAIAMRGTARTRSIGRGIVPGNMVSTRRAGRRRRIHI